MSGSAYRSETGAAVVPWPSTPDPVDPDAYEVCINPNMMALEARREARGRRLGCLLAGFVVAFLVMCLLGAGFLLTQGASL